MSDDEPRTGHASGWTVEEEPEGSFRWSAHGPGGRLRGNAMTRAEAERAAQEAERELAAGRRSGGGPVGP